MAAAPTGPLSCLLAVSLLILSATGGLTLCFKQLLGSFQIGRPTLTGRVPAPGPLQAWPLAGAWAPNTSPRCSAAAGASWATAETGWRPRLVDGCLAS